MSIKTYKVPVPEDLCNYLQRLGTDVDTRLSVIDVLFSNHKDDVDASLFESVPFKHYVKELENAKMAYEQAKLEASNNYFIPMIQEREGREDVAFDWRIDNFLFMEATITIQD